MDTWHTMLLSAVTSLSTALGVLWRAYLKQQKTHDNQIQALQSKLDDAHADHVADVKELTAAAIELAREATYAPPLSRSELPQPDSEG